MTSSVYTDVCRITVHGPNGRADLAVPLAVPLGSLLPVLLRRSGGPTAGSDGGRTTWVLQRLGGPPLDSAGTPDSLDWQDGEEFYLRPVDAPLPELNFDDIADGVATTVSRQPGQWRPEFNRWLFLGFAVAALLAVARVLLTGGDSMLSEVAALCGAAVLVTASAIAVVRGADRMLVLLLGLAGCGLAAIGGAVLPQGTAAALHLQAVPMLGGGLAMAVAGAVLVTVLSLSGTTVSFGPFAAVVLAGVLVVIAQWLHVVVGVTPVRVAGSLCAVMLVVLVFAPRMCLRLARIRGAQLPRTAEELQRDIDPLVAAEVAQRTRNADTLLAVTACATAATYVVSFPFLLGAGVFGTILAMLFAVAAAVRSAQFQGSWQRVPLAAAGALGIGMVVVAATDALGPVARGPALLVLGAALVGLVLAMVRPPTRRMMPLWGHAANWLETVAAVAVVPVLLQVFGVYSLAAGLVG